MSFNVIVIDFGIIILLDGEISWSDIVIYVGGDKVMYNGVEYIVKWWI